ncbi:VOC family protein [Paraburkholderia sp. BCC1884]|uniref:VOC family protein n=1 Tax=Paraburkholderia sp. BCC1884 TaxID=2562668 RepID=UPI001184347C|nr:VOC family protein [Paraburkholderia sp. BCC1884]
MISSIRLDHIVIAVLNLETAVGDYTRLGFNVTTGGRHTHAPTRNALIYFDDGTYLELIEWLAPANGEKWYESLGRSGEGIVDFALCPEDLASVIDRTGGVGAAYLAPVPGSRLQPGGEEIRWQLGWPIDRVLPFLCADITPRSLRVREGDCRQHPNGVKGIRELAVGVPNLDAAIPIYERLLQSKASYPGGSEAVGDSPGPRTAVFHVGESDLLLVEPENVKASGASTSRLLLALRGPGVYRFVLKVAGQESIPFDRALTHGASMSIGIA